MDKERKFLNAQTGLNIVCMLLWGGCLISDSLKKDVKGILLDLFLFVVFVVMLILDYRKYKKEKSPFIMSSFECQRDKLTIRGFEYKPKGEAKGIAIISHGFMAFSGTVAHYAKECAKEGYVTYCFDFCGGCVIKGESDGKTTDMSVLTEVEDLNAVLDYAKKQNPKLTDRIMLMGCSQGGFVSALLASRLKNKIHKLVLFYPAFCIPDDARKGEMMYAVFDPNDIPEVIKCGPMKLGRCYVDDVISMNPYELIKDYVHDVLIVHGNQDDIVSIDYSKKAYDTYLDATNNHRKVIFEVIENGKHGFSKEHDKTAIKILKEFIQ